MAIDPEKKATPPTITKTFQNSELDRKRLQAFVEHYNSKWNIYYHLNQAKSPLTKKAAKGDIARVHYLHVDLDARAGEPLAEELARIKSLITTDLGDTPPPTAVIYSGGGYQALWKLDTPVSISTNEDAVDVERYTKKLEIIYGGDATHNIDRILRLPGTWNVPDEKKKKKGRQLVEAELVEFHEGRAYQLSSFSQAPLVQSPQEANPKALLNKTKIEQTPDLQTLQEQYSLPNRLIVVIAQGRDDDKPLDTEDQSRSAWLFYVVCNLLRHDVPDGTIFGLITDPGWKISESVLDKGHYVESYAWKQIKSGKEFVAKDERSSNSVVPPHKLTAAVSAKVAIESVNSKYAAVRHYNGQFVIIHEQYDPVLKRPMLHFTGVAHFQNALRNRQVRIPTGDKKKPDVYIALGKFWLDSAYRREYETITFAPNKTPEDVYNLWRGFGVEARSVIPPDELLYLKHIKNNLCSGNQEHYNYVLGWMANAVQKPDQPGQTAIVLKGKRGTGKSVFAKMFGDLFGRHYLMVSNASHLTGNFNFHLKDCVVLFADEAFYAGDKKHEGVLKTLITEETNVFEQKGKDINFGKNCTHIIMGSNNDWVVPAGEYERRFLVLEMSEQQLQKTDYFDLIVKQQREEGGAESLLHYLLNYDISEFNVRNPPKTEALQDQIAQSRAPELSWWLSKLEDGAVLDFWPDKVPVLVKAVKDDYIQYCKDMNIHSNARLNPVWFGRFLKKMVPGLIKKQAFVNGKKQTVYQFSSLQSAREAWVDLQGSYIWEADGVEHQRPEEPF